MPEIPEMHACWSQITKATVPRAPKLMRMLLAGAFGGLPPVRVRDVSDVLTTFLRVRELVMIFVMPRRLLCSENHQLHCTPLWLLSVHLLKGASCMCCQTVSARRMPFWLLQFLVMHRVWSAASEKGVPCCRQHMSRA